MDPNDNHQWAVILFKGDNCVATVPKNWLLNINNVKYSYWPPKVKNASVLVKKRELPQKTWPKYDVRILGLYDDYETAAQKCHIAEDTSELSTGPDDKQIRKRKPNKRYVVSNSSSTESELENSDEDQSPAFPNIKRKKSDVFKAIQLKPMERDSFCEDESFNFLKKNEGHKLTIVHSNEMASSPANESADLLRNVSLDYSFCVPQPPKERPFSTQNMSQRMSPSNNSSPRGAEVDFKRQVLNKLNILNAKIFRFEEHLEEIKKLLLERNEKASDVEDDFIENSFPIMNDAQLNAVEEILQEKGAFKKIVKDFSLMGGNSVNEMTKKIMYRIISNEFGQSFSWEGAKGKRKFCDLRLSKLVIEAVRRNKRTSNACDDEIILAVKKWLVKAKERAANANQKLTNMT